MIFDRYRAYSEEPVKLRPEFVDSAVDGSLFVFSVVPEIDASFGASVIGDHAVVRASVGCYHTVIVAGIHKHFRDWNMPQVSDEAARKSWALFNQEYTGPKC